MFQQLYNFPVESQILHFNLELFQVHAFLSDPIGDTSLSV